MYNSLRIVFRRQPLGESTVSTVTLEDAQTRLGELIAGLQPGEEIVITSAERAVARIVGEPQPAPQPRRLGMLKGSVLYTAPDFDAPLDDFKEYME
jgi:antitoxin (DNA-binding transcriptional repressor) of toxin-antitoxin stability system